MIVYFYWNGLILNIRFYFQYFFFNSEIYFCRHFILLTRNCIPDLARAGLDVKMLAHAQRPWISRLP